MAAARRRGRILAVKWGINPNSSSLGVDVTFLLFGLSAITLLTPVLSFLLRRSRRRLLSSPTPSSPPGGAPTSGASASADA